MKKKKRRRVKSVKRLHVEMTVFVPADMSLDTVLSRLVTALYTEPALVVADVQLQEEVQHSSTGAASIVPSLHVRRVSRGHLRRANP